MTFHFPVRVYYEDTDAGGVVFYANYLKFFERARTEWLRHLGVNQSELAREQKCMFVVVGTELQYRSPARLDDMIDIRSTITELTRTSVTFTQKAYRIPAQVAKKAQTLDGNPDYELLVESQIRICAVHTERFRPISIPEHVRSLFAREIQQGG